MAALGARGSLRAGSPRLLLSGRVWGEARYAGLSPAPWERALGWDSPAKAGWAPLRLSWNLLRQMSLLLEQSVAPLRQPGQPREHRTPGEPRRPHGRCRETGDRGEEEGWGPEDLWVARVRFTRRKGNGGTDRAMEPASPSPCLRAAAQHCIEPTFCPPTLPSTTEGAQVPCPPCLPPPRLQRLPLLPQSSFSSTEGT